MNFRNLLVQLGLVAGNAAAKWDPSGIAALLLEAYGKKREKDQLRAELDAMMRADFQQFRAQVQDAMGELRLQLAESVRAQVEAYLSQFQASAKQAARHLGHHRTGHRRGGRPPATRSILAPAPAAIHGWERGPGVAVVGAD